MKRELLVHIITFYLQYPGPLLAFFVKKFQDTMIKVSYDCIFILLLLLLLLLFCLFDKAYQTNKIWRQNIYIYILTGLHEELAIKLDIWENYRMYVDNLPIAGAGSKTPKEKVF